MAAAIATGGWHSCAIAVAGELLCWGDDSEYQLGVEAGGHNDGGAERHVGFAKVLDRTEQVAAGGMHSCAIASWGGLYCWGNNAQAQVDGMLAEALERDRVELPVEAPVHVAAGAAHTCAVVDEGVVCWGSARFGQVGQTITDAPLSPELVPDTEDAVEVTAGARHTCARLESGRVQCWGELIAAASGARQPTATPVLVPNLEDATQIAAGAGHTCALRAEGSVVCWGFNGSGQLGHGTTRSSATPLPVIGLELSFEVRAGGAEREGELVGHTCALTKSFRVQCWGRNAEGQLGVGRAADMDTATVVLREPDDSGDDPYLRDMTAIAAGGFHTCAVDHHGRVLCWGDDTRDQLGEAPDDRASFGRATRVARFNERH